MPETLFDVAEAERIKKEGMERAVKPRAVLLLTARWVARQLAIERGEVNCDDVYRRLDFMNRDVSILGNAAGSIFSGPQWEFTGRWVKSTRTSNHGRYIRVWRLKA